MRGNSAHASSKLRHKKLYFVEKLSKSKIIGNVIFEIGNDRIEILRQNSIDEYMQSVYVPSSSVVIFRFKNYLLLNSLQCLFQLTQTLQKCPWNVHDVLWTFPGRSCKVMC